METYQCARSLPNGAPFADVWGSEFGVLWSYMLLHANKKHFKLSIGTNKKHLHQGFSYDIYTTEI